MYIFKKTTKNYKNNTITKILSKIKMKTENIKLKTDSKY